MRIKDTVFQRFRYDMEWMLIFGFAGALAAQFHFTIPESEGAVLDPREFFTLLGVMFVSRGWWAFGIGFIAALGGPFQSGLKWLGPLPSNYLITIAMYTLLTPCAWAIYHHFLKRIQSRVWFSFLWFFMVLLVYYWGFLALYSVLQSLFPPAGKTAWELYDTLAGYYVEPILTALTTTFAALLIKVLRETNDERSRNLLQLSAELESHKKTEEALRESEHLYRSLFESMLSGFAVVEIVCDHKGRPADFRFIEVNSAFEQHTGLKPKNILGRTIREVLPEVDPYWIETYGRVALTGEPLYFERFSKGLARYLSVAAYCPKQGQCATVLRDITRLKRLDDALREGEERMRLGLEGSNVGLWDWDVPNGNVVFVRHWAEILGYPKEETENHIRMWEQCVHPEDKPWVTKALQDHLEGRTPFYETEHRLRAKSGQWRWMLDRGKVIVRDKDGKALRAVGMHLDVTDRKQAEEALLKSQAELDLRNKIANIFLTVSDNAMFADVVALLLGAFQSQHGFFGFINGSGDLAVPSLARIPWEGFHAPEENLIFPRAQWRGIWNQALQEGKTIIANTPTQVLESSGAPRRSISTPILHRGAPIGLFLLADRQTDYEEADRRLLESVANFTAPVLHARLERDRKEGERSRSEEERRKLETQVQHAQKLESLGVLAGGIAHDFNNLLMAIMGNAELALADLSPAAPGRDNILEIEAASRRAAELCRQMLAYSGRGRFIVEALNLSEVVKEMGHILGISISKKVVLKYNFANNLPAVRADATQIRQVIMNLITNASEAIGDRSGVVSISTGAMHCDKTYLASGFLNENLPEGLYAYLEVSDTGCGMDGETQSKIFDPFFTTKFTGRGLGLAAVLGIVRGHKGIIKVYSELERGTTIKVLLPATQQPAPLSQSSKPAPSEWRGEGTILLVDDEDSVLAVGKQMLERHGFSVMLASNGREALELFRRHNAEIVCTILDLAMPHMDGEETFRELRRIRPGVRVVLSSGYNEQDISERFSGKGLAGFIHKPYRLEDLIAVVRTALEGSPSKADVIT